jgi:trk system potassium uptake protein TrkH
MAGVRAVVVDLPGYLRRLLGSAGGGIKMIARWCSSGRCSGSSAALASRRRDPLKIGGQVVPNQVVFAVLAFFSAWLTTLVLVTLLLAATGSMPHRVFRRVRVAQQYRPGLQEVGPPRPLRPHRLSDLGVHRHDAPRRLELLTVLVIFTPRSGASSPKR